ncbi:hypothetical protein [Flavobacterium agrisoli]|uniref:Lipoprotein n=1 Tax=Flavobacterium agrisoli TaxID=2793066 RepID=A0A934UL83_9FLAO|nr:hypothetical protein [Flavobacterium agrisoli]MBK0371235.1 hypothetical protein [Flavobacterium agrisoli]
MKKYIYITALLFFIFGCSSTNKSIDPINAYLKETVKTNDTIVIITNKINNNYALDLWKERVDFKDASVYMVESVDENPRIYEEKYWAEMNEKYRNHDTDSLWLRKSLWKQKEFKNFKVKWMTEKVFPKPYIYSEYMDKIPEKPAFSFSEPMIYKKTYVVFAFAKTTTGRQFINPRSFLIMKKEKGKWIIVKEITDGFYY